MAKVEFTAHLRRWFPELKTVVVTAGTVTELLQELDQLHPGLAAYIVDDRGRLRQHVNIFVNRDMIHDREKLSDTLDENDQVHIFQALSGG